MQRKIFQGKKKLCKLFFSRKEFSKRKGRKVFKIKIKNKNKNLEEKFKKKDKRWSTKPWYTLSFGPILFFFFWRKALGHEVIIYPNFWGQNSKIIFKSKRAQDHEYVIGFIEKLWTNPCFRKILKPYNPKTWVGSPRAQWGLKEEIFLNQLTKLFKLGW